MGALGEVFALRVYLGTTGLEAILRMQTEELPMEEVMHLQKCLMASFEAREELDKKDLAVIRELGLKFRGRNAWPQFRHYEPGFFPWYLDAYQVRFLTAVIQQAMDVAIRYRENPSLLLPSKKNQYLVRVPEQTQDGIQWSDQWLKPVFEPHQQEKTVFADEVRLRRLQETVKSKLGTWEVEYFYAPFSVKGPDRPYYPQMCLWVDHETGMILHFHIADSEAYQQEFVSVFVELLEKMGGLPRKLLVRNSGILDCFEDTARKLKIKIERVPVLPYMKEAREGMFENFAR